MTVIPELEETLKAWKKKKKQKKKKKEKDGNKESRK